MYRVYRLSKKEVGKIWRRRWDGDTEFYDVYEDRAELEKDLERLARIEKEAEAHRAAYINYLLKEEGYR